ncbi:protein rotatin homolog [Ochlerotatus camptorhynchus]|uniref:protein rotatin homolog n=1 Tax=Ochlerotatus camptorhynchus TaxID=644619 RepID=UPI0031D17EE1
MTLVISSDMLAKLSHEILEIRVRTLHDIENKVKRALWEHEDIKFNPSSLVKNLIRWFGNVPICEEAAVLELMSLLLASHHGSSIVNYFTSKRLITEMGKVKYLVGSKSELMELVDNIIQLVNDFKETERSRNPESIAESLASLKIECVDLTDSPRQSLSVNQAKGPNYYTKCWEVPPPPDAKVFKDLNESLHPQGDEKVIKHAFSYLVRSINDYPPEFFLQPPYVLHSLIRLLDAKRASLRTTIEMFHRLTISIQKRLKSLQLTSMYIYQDTKKQCLEETSKVQISVSAFAHELFLLGINSLKEVSDDIDVQVSNKIVNLLHELLELTIVQPLEEFQFREIRHELGYLAKHFRQSWESNSKSFAIRTKYLVTINILSRLLQIYSDTQSHESADQHAPLNDTCFPHKPRYNPTEFETMNSTNQRRIIEYEDQIWLHELQIAALDYPMKHIYPSIHGPVLELALKSDSNRKMQILLGADEILAPAIAILRQPTALTDEELVMNGLNAIDSLYLHRSIGLVKLLIRAVGNCHGYFEGNYKLRDAAEKLILRLLSHSDERIKSAAYDQCNVVMKDFISSLDEGAILTHRKGMPKAEGKLASLGIPLSVEILIEVICFGYCSANRKIQQQAETILLFVLNSRAFLLDRWTDLLDIIAPVLPLLQTIGIIKIQSTLSRAIFVLLHPDSRLSPVDLLRGNLRYLFQDDPEVREEALTRVMFLMSIAPNAHQYSPNIEHIRDTLSNGICLTKSRYDVAKHLSTDVFEVSAVKPLLDTLEQDNCDPGIRRSALIQLNAMAEDPILCEIIHKANGWAFVLQVLDNALREQHFLDYPDSAVPAIGILTKLCFTIPEFRRFLADDVNVYYLIVRALLSFHHFPIFKPDCCSLLFLLLFSEYTLGSGKAVSLPVICQNYRIPFVCEYHWKCSPFNELSYLEEIFVDVEGEDRSGMGAVEGNSILRRSGPCGIECATSRMRRLETSGGESMNQTTESSVYLHSYRQVAWQYLRLAFACQWFDAFENVLINAKRSRQSPGKEGALIVDYNLLPPHLISPKRTDEDEEVIVLDDSSLEFDRALHLAKQDLNMIRTSQTDEIFRNSLKAIAAAASHAEVSIGLAGLESNLILPMKEQILHNSIVKHLKKFVLTPPNTPADEQLLIDVFNLLGDLIQIGYENVLVWIVSLLFEQTSIFIQLLKSETCSEELFMKNVDFIQIVLQGALACENPNVTSLLINAEGFQMKVKREHNFNLLNRLFEIITSRLDSDLQKCNIGKMISLISLARVIVHSALIEFESKFLNHVINKLCSYITRIGMITYSGSTIIKNCLIIISLLLDQMREVHLKTKHFKVIAMQCSHTSILIRSCAWNVLAKVAKFLSGAHSIIKECAYLPGGIHACCINTILDPEEASLVKESAAGLLINLLSHKGDKDGPLHKYVIPCDKVSNHLSDADALETVFTVLRKHRFFEQALESLQNFTTRDEMAVGEFDGIQMVNCDVVKSYSMIFSCLVDLVPELIDHLTEKCCLQRLMNCVSNVPLHPERSALLMVSEVCNLMMRCLKHKKEEICELISPYQAVIGGVIYLLNADLYQNYDEKVFREVTGNIMQLLNAMVVQKVGNQLITGVLSELKLEPLIRLLIRGISNHKQKDYQIACLRFLTLLVVTSNSSAASVCEFQSFLGLLETVPVANAANHSQQSTAAADTLPVKSIQRLRHLSDGFSSDEDQENHDPNRVRKRLTAPVKPDDSHTPQTGSECIFAALMEQFQISCLKDKPENGALLSTFQKRTLFSAIQVMLHQSEKARKVARTRKFLEMLLDRLEAIYSGIGINYQDFVKKFGEGRKAPVVEELSFIAGILSAWFVRDILVHQANINYICRLFLQFWPWIKSNRELEAAFMKALVCLTENSIVVCKSLSIPYAGHPHSILKLTIAAVTAETGKVKGPNSEITLLGLCLRVLMNCCSCHEGRVMITKFNVLDNMSKLHPAVTKLQKPWVTVTKLWLQFWEIYTRHSDVTEVKHLTVLGAFIRKSTPELRRLSLEIMRNMSFVNNNRPALLASQDYMYALKSVLDETDPAEQLLVVSSIWKIIANNNKGKSAIKSSPIPRRLNALLKQRSLLERCEDDDLFNVLNITVNLLNS